jgi:hypothetical protein
MLCEKTGFMFIVYSLNFIHGDQLCARQTNDTILLFSAFSISFSPPHLLKALFKAITQLLLICSALSRTCPSDRTEAEYHQEKLGRLLSWCSGWISYLLCVMK